MSLSRIPTILRVAGGLVILLAVSAGAISLLLRQAGPSFGSAGATSERARLGSAPSFGHDGALLPNLEATPSHPIAVQPPSAIEAEDPRIWRDPSPVASAVEAPMPDVSAAPVVQRRKSPRAKASAAHETGMADRSAYRRKRAGPAFIRQANLRALPKRDVNPLVLGVSY